MHTVIIMGAGASVEAGAPVMADFIDRAEDLYLDPSSQIRSRESFRLALEELRRLRSIHATAFIDLNNLEAFLGVVEMQELVAAGTRESGGLQVPIRDHLATLIVETLEETTPVLAITRPNLDAGIVVGSGNRQLAGFLARRPKGAASHTVGIITFNYDIVFEVACATVNHKLDYGFDASIAADATPFLKLHGSIGWGWCQKCRRIQRADIPRLVRKVAQSGIVVNTHFPLRPFHDLQMGNGCECGVPFRPVIVPPSWNKGAYRSDLVTVWGHAAAQLQQADRIVVIGYSLPESDAFFRYLFAIGTNTLKTRLRRVWVINPDGDRAVESRMRQFIGRGLSDRLVFHRGKAGEFSNCVGALGQLLDTGTDHHLFDLPKN